jgi:hypothetical protein
LNPRNNLLASCCFIRSDPFPICLQDSRGDQIG